MTTRLTALAAAGALALTVTGGLGVASAAAPTGTTTTVALQATTLAYGDTAKVTVSVDAVTNGPKPAGKVELKVGDKTLLADVTNSGKVDFDWPLVNASTAPYAVTAAFVPTDAAAFSASASVPVNATVTKDATTSQPTLSHNLTRNKVVARTTVTSAHGQVPTGKAKFVLRRNGIKVGSSIVGLSATGGARARFGNVPDRGTYKVIAKYLGSANFAASKGTVTAAS